MSIFSVKPEIHCWDFVPRRLGLEKTIGVRNSQPFEATRALAIFLIYMHKWLWAGVSKNSLGRFFDLGYFLRQQPRTIYAYKWEKSQARE